MAKINTLIEEFTTPPFSQIMLSDYLPAIENAIEIARKNVDEIIENKEKPNFDNCIEPLEFAANKLDAITPIFFNLNHANTSDEMQELAVTISNLLTKFANDISLNVILFAKVNDVYINENRNNLDTQQIKLLENTYKSFMREGAALTEDKKDRYRSVTESLSQLSLTFSQNLLAETNSFYLHIEDIEDLAGLPEYVREIGKAEARDKNLKGWVYTLAAQSYVPFMQFSENRTRREFMWTKYNTRCFNSPKYDNQQVILQITSFKRELAVMLGYKNYAEYALEQRMSKTEEKVDCFIEDLITRTESYANKDWKDVEEFARSVGFEGDLMGWDFAFYAEKYKIIKYQISDDKLKPYFKLENVCEGLFDVVNKLYGIEFKLNEDVDKYHSDMVAYDIIEKNKPIALLYMDFFPRESKNSGAWMTSYKDKMIYNNQETIPIISVVCNFTKPTISAPSLLTFNEVTTLFHEVGHALHGIFAKGRYASLNGTNVAWDFVELPSQIMENWAYDSYFLSKWAKHYETGEPIPADYITKLKLSENFLSGYAQMRQLSFAKNDMAWHTITENVTVSVKEFESKAVKQTQISPFVENCCFSTAFSHIFAGGYAAGYYSYKWAEVLEADAFSKFIEMGVYNTLCSNSFRKDILSQGGQCDAMELYVSFMGREPNSDALFNKLGLIN